MNILEIAKKYEQYIIDMRRHFHMNPEPSMQEYETSKRVQEELDKMGVEYVVCGNGIGVLATIKGAKPGKTVLLRADMDALTVNEENDLPYKSVKEGVMHACGHDAHTALLLGAAQILKDMKEELCGTVKLAFQPAEEIGKGALAMIAEGAMEGVDAVFGQHIWSGVESGKISIQPGPRMASAAQYEIKVQGKGGHGAMPAECIDAVTCSCAIVNSMQTVVSREFRPNDAVVVTVGTVNVGTRWNVIADNGSLTGTTRCYDKTVLKELPERMERIARGIGEAYRCDIEFTYEDLLGPTVNHPEMTAVAAEAAKKIYGEENLVHMDATTGGEDFSYFIEAAPNNMGAFAFPGIASVEWDSCHAHHSPKFKVDESALLKGAALYCQVAADFNCK